MSKEQMIKVSPSFDLDENKADEFFRLNRGTVDRAIARIDKAVSRVNMKKLQNRMGKTIDTKEALQDVIPIQGKVKVYAIRNDKNGYPHFLIYEDNQWKWKSAKHFTPEDVEINERRCFICP